MAKPGYKSARRNKDKPARPVRTGTGKPGGARSGKPPHGPKSAAKTPEQMEVTSSPTTAVDKQPPPPLKPRSGHRLPEQTARTIIVQGDDHYALLDSGLGEKLERYGKMIIRRPEGQALWLPSLPASKWSQADAVFTGDIEEEGQGRWQYPKGNLDETWQQNFDGMAYLGRFTSFRHTGVFPEQAAHWQAMDRAIRTARAGGRTVRVLNLFGYTGLASLVAARAGAEVTHVDASKRAVGWARENQEIAGLAKAPIRWICDDAVKFCAREVRRGNTYDIVLLDPPAYGRGPKGEVWQLFEHLPHMLDLVRDIQSNNPVMTVLTSYAIRASHFALHELMQHVFAGMDGRLESGELVLQQQSGERVLSTSMYCRFLGEGVEV